MTAPPAWCTAPRAAAEASQPRRALRLALALAALAVARPAAAAAPRIAIAAVDGDQAGAVGAQLTAALCSESRCVPGAVDGSRASLKRARKMGVEAAVLASVRRERGRRELSVQLVSSAARPLRSWRLPLGRRGLLSRAELDRLARQLQASLRPLPRRAPQVPRSAPRSAVTFASVTPGEALSGPTPAPAPEPAGTAADVVVVGGDLRDAEVRRPSLQARSAAPAFPVDPGPVDVIVVPRSRLEVPPPSRRAPAIAAPGSAPGGPIPPTLTADLGFLTGRRALRFPSDGTAPVGYKVDVRVAPDLRLELHPLRDLGDLAAGLGVFAEGAYKSGMPLAADAHAFRVSYLRLRAGVTFHVAALRPVVAWEVERVSVRTATGEPLPGLPDTSLAGPSMGLDLAVPAEWWSQRLTLLGGGRAIWWMRSGELAGGGQYFPGGFSVGVEAEAGAAYRFSRVTSIRLLGRYGKTMWWLEPDTSKAYTVRSASADTFGVDLALRLDF